MQPDYRSSFIPKKSIKRVERVRSGRRIYILNYITYAIFLATLIAVAFVYFYSQFLEAKLSNAISELESQRAAFSQGKIQQVKEIERRLKLADYLFAQHASVYVVLSEIERLAVENIYFESFSYSRADDSVATVSLTGRTDRFDRVAFQNSLMEGAQVLDQSEFTGLAKAGEYAETNPSGNSVIQNQTGRSRANRQQSDLPVGFAIGKDLLIDAIVYDPTIYASIVETQLPDPAFGSTTEAVLFEDIAEDFVEGDLLDGNDVTP